MSLDELIRAERSLLFLYVLHMKSSVSQVAYAAWHKEITQGHTVRLELLCALALARLLYDCYYIYAKYQMMIPVIEILRRTEGSFHHAFTSVVRVSCIWWGNEQRRSADALGFSFVWGRDSLPDLSSFDYIEASLWAAAPVPRCWNTAFGLQSANKHR